MAEPIANSSRAICNYEGTSYRSDFWEGHGREYEDLAERIALRHLLPPQGGRLLEVGAGFGRLADLYGGYEQVVLLDYAQSGLREAQERLGRSERFLFVAADVYRLPLTPGSCDAAVSVRVLHHLVDIPSALRSIHAALRPGGTYILEYANKRNLKSLARFALRRQNWSPLAEEPVEFVELNFDFHPRWLARQLTQAGFVIQAGRAVSYFRTPALKNFVPAPTLAAVDGLLQVPGAPLKLAPSVFLRCRPAYVDGKHGAIAGGAGSTGQEAGSRLNGIFRCLECGGQRWQEEPAALVCLNCGAAWNVRDGIFDFVSPATMRTARHS